MSPDPHAVVVRMRPPHQIGQEGNGQDQPLSGGPPIVARRRARSEGASVGIRLNVSLPSFSAQRTKTASLLSPTWIFIEFWTAGGIGSDGGWQIGLFRRGVHGQVSHRRMKRATSG